MDVALFKPFTVRELTIPNRIWVAPMCQYAIEAADGVPTDWHLVHLGALAQGGYGLVIAEATSVTPEGRISLGDAGLWNDEQAAAWKRVVDFVHTQQTKIGIQIAHAGRKASTYRWLPGEPDGSLTPEDGAWQTVAPSAVAMPGLAEPVALDEAGIRQVVDDFAAAAKRAIGAGFDVLEIHAAHGYLLHEFLSPLSNQRTDSYSGSLENRMRLLVEIVDAIRGFWSGPLFVRISATDWIEGGWDVAQSVELAKVLKEHGVDLMDVSSGGLVDAPIPVEPGYQVPLAEQIRREAGIATASAGLISEPQQANDLVAGDRTDAVLLGRAALREPRFPQRAAHELGLPLDEAPWAPQHLRGALR